MTWFPWLLLIMVVAAGAVSVVLPRLTRPDIFFGVTVDPAFRDSEVGRGVLRRYTMHMLLYVVAGIALTIFGAQQNRPGLATAAIGIVALGSIVTLVQANRRVLPHAAKRNPVREASLTVRENKLPGGWILWIIPFLILAASGVYLHEHWNEIPARFPIHWGIDGQPNGWAIKSPSSVYGMLLLGAGTCLMMAVMNFSILRSRRIALRGTAAQYEQSFRTMNVWTLLATEYFMAFLFAGIPLVSIFEPGTAQFAVLVDIAFTVSFFVVLILVGLRYGQGGTRLAGQAAITEPPIGDRTPDECWKWGMIYFNPEDPAIMVEKRMGLGYTMNFANVWSWVILGGALLLPVISIFLMRG